ncbi:MAG: hypothetical protein VYB15_03715, partial [Planctomycetota bacterium]|nr:hypothetical protein [Planctomycetota bacterium]
DLRRNSGKLDKGTIPLLVASSYKKMVSASPRTSEKMTILNVAIALVLGIGCIVGIVILVVNRRSDSTYDARRRASREKGVLAREGEAAGEEASFEDKAAGNEDD